MPKEIKGYNSRGDFLCIAHLNRFGRWLCLSTNGYAVKPDETAAQEWLREAGKAEYVQVQ